MPPPRQARSSTGASSTARSAPIYGFGMVIVLFVLTPFEHSTLALYIGGVILPSTLELVGGWALYKLYHTRWWDYSDKPFNIGGYICLEFSLLWGVGTLVMMKAIHPTIAGLVELVPPFIGFLLMCFLYAVYAADVVVTAVAASDLARELDALENVADSIHAVSDAMTEILGTTAMEADQKLDENRLQFKLAAAEAGTPLPSFRPREAAEAMRRKADEAREAARRASEISRLNAAEAAKAVKLAAKGTAERTAELLQLEQLAEELAARSEELREHPPHGPLWQGPYAPRLPQTAPWYQTAHAGRTAGAPQIRAQALCIRRTKNGPSLRDGPFFLN